MGAVNGGRPSYVKLSISMLFALRANRPDFVSFGVNSSNSLGHKPTRLAPGNYYDATSLS